MTENMFIKIELLTAAMPGRGDGVAGLVDFEVEHDGETGLPFIKSRTIKGMLVEECANILHALKAQRAPEESQWHDSAGFLFGKPGSFLTGSAQVQFGAAQLHHELRDAVKYAQSLDGNSTKSGFRMDKAAILEAAPGIRRRSSINTETGCPEDRSLRSARLVLRGLTFYSAVFFESEPSARSLALLSASIRALRHLGSSRNRGLGVCDCQLLDKEFRDAGKMHLTEFANLIGGRK